MECGAHRPKTLLVTTVKDEGPNILEWVAHHRAIGFDRIQIYQNDSFDGTERSLRTLAAIGAIEYFPNPSPRRQWQNKAYRRASHSPAYSEADWCMALDGDEFLFVKCGGGTVGDLIAACEGFDEINVNWRNFGSAGRLDAADELVTCRFTQADAADSIVATRPAGIKTLFRTDCYRRPGIHLPKVPLREGIRRCNGSALPEGSFKLVGWRSFDPGARALAQVNHYAVRDLESFLLKSVRGSSSHPDREISLHYWRLNDINDEADRGLAARASETERVMSELDELSGGRLGHLRRRALAKWRSRLDALLLEPDVKALREAILALRSDACAPKQHSA